MEQLKGVKSFLQKAAEKQGTEYDEVKADDLIKSYDNDLGRLVDDVGTRFGFQPEELPGFRERAFKEYSFTQPDDVNRAEIDYISKPTEFTDEVTGYERYSKLEEERSLGEQLLSNLQKEGTEKEIPIAYTGPKVPGVDFKPVSRKEMIYEPQIQGRITDLQERVKSINEQLSQQSDINVKETGFISEQHKLTRDKFTAYDKLFDEAIEQRGEQAKVKYTSPAGMGAGVPTVKYRPEDVRRVRNLRDIKSTYKKIGKILEAPQGKDEQLKGLWHGLTQSNTARDFWTMGINEMARNLNVKDAFDKLQAAKEDAKSKGVSIEQLDEVARNTLDQEEQALLETYTMLQNVQAGSRANTGAIVGEGLQDMIPFIMEFAMTSGTSVAAKKVVKEFVENRVKNATLAKVAGGVTKIGVQATIMPTTAKGFAERTAPVIGEEGELVPGEDPGEALLKSYLTTAAEVIGEDAAIMGARALRKKAIQKLANDPGKAQEFIAKIGAMMSAETGVPTVQAVPFELFSEEITGVLQAAIDNDGSFFTPEAQWQLLLMTSLAGGGAVAFSAPKRIGVKKSYNKSVEGLQDIPNEDYTTDVQNATESITDPEELVKTFEQITKTHTGKISEEDYKKARNFIGNSIRYNQMSVTRNVQIEKGIAEFEDDNGNVSKAVIDGQEWYIRNPQDIGTGKVIFAKNDAGEVKGFPNQSVKEAFTQTPDEVEADIDQEDEFLEAEAEKAEAIQQDAADRGIEVNKTVVGPHGKGTVISINEDGTVTVADTKGDTMDVQMNEVEQYKTQEQKDAEKEEVQAEEDIQQALMEGIEEGAEVESDESQSLPDETEIRIVNFTNGQSKVITAEGEQVFNTTEERDNAIKTIVESHIAETEASIDDLAPEERFNQLFDEDPEIAETMLQDDIGDLNSQAGELRKAKTTNKKERLANLKQAKQLEAEAKRLETLLEETKQKLTETGDILPEKVEKVPEIKEEVAVEEEVKIPEEPISSQKVEPTPEPGLQKEQQQLDVSKKAAIGFKDKQNAQKALVQLQDEFGIPVKVIHSSEMSRGAKRKAKKQGIIPVGYYENGIAYVLSDATDMTVSDVKKTYLHEAILHKGLDVIFKKGPITVLGKTYETKNDLLLDVYNNLDEKTIADKAKVYGITIEEGVELSDKQKVEIAEEVMATINEIPNVPTKVRNMFNSLGKWIRANIGFSKKQFTNTDLQNILAEHRALIKQAVKIEETFEATTEEIRFKAIAIDEGSSVAIADPSELKEISVKQPTKVAVNPDGHKLSFVDQSDIIDIKSLISDINKNNQKVWFWVADQLGRGMYSDNVVGKEHYLDAGPSYALDPINRDKDIIWATGKSVKESQRLIDNSDYIFITSGSPEKSKLFNKKLIDIFAERVGDFDTFKKDVLEVSKIGRINKILNEINSFEELANSPKRKNFLIDILAQKAKKATPLKKLLEERNAFIDVNQLRDGFYADNGFELNDVMLVLKPTGVKKGSTHSTYENDILGEVIGVPDSKIDAYDIMINGVKAKYDQIENFTKAMKQQAVSPYGIGIRDISPMREWLEGIGRIKPEDIRFRQQQAREETETDPSEAQIKAGNYKKGSLRFDGFDISIENPKGSIRSGEDRTGKKWSREMPVDYGYFKGTVGNDKDHIDVFMGDNLESDKIYVIDQIDPETGKFDEHKIMLGFDNVSKARNTYNSAYEEGWAGLGQITRTDKEGLKEWFKGETKKPFAGTTRFRITEKTTDPEIAKLFERLSALEKVSKATVKVKEFEEEKRLAPTFEKPEIEKQIKDFKEGVKAGKKFSKEQIDTIEKTLIDYVGKNLDLGDAGARDIKSIFTAIRKARTPKSIDKAFEKIDELTGKVTSKGIRNKNVGRIKRLMKWMGNPDKFVYSNNVEFKQFRETDRETIKQQKILNSPNSTETEKTSADNALDRMWNELDAKVEERTMLEDVQMKLIEYRRNKADASDELVASIQEDLQIIYDAAKDAKKGEDIQKAIDRKSDREFVKGLIAPVAKEDQGWAKRARMNLNNFTANTMGNWETLLNQLGGQKLRDKFSLILNQANQEVSRQATFDKVLDEAREAYGFETKEEMLKHLQELKKKEFSLVKPIREGERGAGKDLELSRMDIMDLYNAIKNANIRNDAYMTYGDISLAEDGSRDTEAQLESGKARIDGLIDNLTDSDKDFADDMQIAVDSYYGKINEIFIKSKNRDLPKMDNYWPSSAEFASENDAFEQFRQDSMHPTATKEREKHRTVKVADAFDKFVNHVKSGEWYANMALPVTRMNNILKNPNVKDLIVEARGIDFYKTMITHLQEQGLNPPSKAVDPTGIENVASTVLNNWVTAAIGLSPSVPVKQLLSVINYAENMPSDKWATGFTKAMTDPVETWKEMMKIPYLRTRLGTGYSEALQYVMNADSSAPKAATAWQKMKNYMTAGTRYGDIAAIAFGGKPYLDYLVEEKGMSYEAAVDQFLLDTLRSQQSPFSSSLSTWQNSKNVIKRSIFAFSNTPSQYMRKMFEANEAFRRGDIDGKQLSKVYAIYGVLASANYVIVGALMSALLSGSDWDDDLLEKVLVQFGISAVGGIPIAKDLAEGLGRTLVGLDVYDDVSPILEGANKLIEVSKKLANADEDTDKAKLIATGIKYLTPFAGISSRNIEKVWKATVKRGETFAITRGKKTDKTLTELAAPKKEMDASLERGNQSKFYLNFMRNQPDYKEAESAHNLKSAYSSIKTKATKLEKEGDTAKADRLRDLVESSKANMAQTDFVYSDIESELRQFNRLVKLYTK